MMLITAYDRAIAKGDINEDLKQREVLFSMQRVMDELTKPKPSWWQSFCKSKSKGIYLYGPVGVGKTYLMDLFYQQATEPKKARFHFHHFMQKIDAKLRQRQGQRDPLKKLARDLGQSIRLLCLDEFLVQDVAQAMILSELFQALFSNGIVLVATSNTPPDDLYLNGVNRKRFLPAIELIKTRCEVISLVQRKDYRMGRESLLQAYLYPLNAKTNAIFAEQFSSITQNAFDKGSLNVQNRDVPFIKCCHRVIWFDFKVICNLPRSSLDYLDIANRFDTVFVSDIPVLSAKDTVYVILLIHFVDVMYDRGIKLIISAAVPLDQLYLEGEMLSEFKRTLSRLQEMQSVDYLQRHPWRHEQDFATI